MGILLFGFRAGLGLTEQNELDAYVAQQPLMETWALLIHTIVGNLLGRLAAFAFASHIANGWKHRAIIESAKHARTIEAE